MAEWAAPIVVVLKQDKQSVRICGDFRITINPVFKLDHYPIPRVEDLFARLSKCLPKLSTVLYPLHVLLRKDVGLRPSEGIHSF